MSNTKDYAFVLNDEFGYNLNMTTNNGMFFVYQPKKINDIHRVKTSKDLLMEVFKLAQ